jgi:hypothetical protein
MNASVLVKDLGGGWQPGDSKRAELHAAAP